MKLKLPTKSCSFKTDQEPVFKTDRDVANSPTKLMYIGYGLQWHWFTETYNNIQVICETSP